MPVETSSKATFYHYKLLKKISIPKSLNYSLIIVPILWLAAEIVLFSWSSIFFFILALPIAGWIQYVIARSVILMLDTSYKKRWRFSWRFPWLGYMPDQYVSYSIYQRVQLHSSWIGLVIIAALIPWSPVSFVLALLFCHLWIMAPRLIPLISFHKLADNGIIKFNEKDISYYMP